MARRRMVSSSDYRPDYDLEAYHQGRRHLLTGDRSKMNEASQPKRTSYTPPFPRTPPPASKFPFRGDSYRPDDNFGGFDRYNEFSFRNNNLAPDYPLDRSMSPEPSRDGPRHNGQQERPRRKRNLNRTHGRGKWSNGNWSKYGTADRPLLRFQRGTTPDQMLGMGESQLNVNRFLRAEDLSDSGEEDMDQSESESGAIAVDNSPLKELNDGKYQAEPESDERPAKRQALEVSPRKKDEGARLPQWSNPDPYTVLPPPDESQRKKKDVIKLIRKARILAKENNNVKSQVASNDDFISFGFEDEIKGDTRNDESQTSPKGAPGAPSAPRSFSHLDHLHKQDSNKPPGAESILTAASLGAPPNACENSGPPKSKPAATSLADPPNTRAIPRPEISSTTTSLGVAPNACVSPVPESNLTAASLSAPPNAGETSNLPYVTPVSSDESTALGTRKRKLDDEPSRSIRRGRSKLTRFSVSVLPEWVPPGDIDPTPWLDNDHRCTELSGFRLHKEICDFYDFVKPQKFEQIVREDLLKRLNAIVKAQFRGCKLMSFGSFAAGLYLPNADMDVVVVSDDFLKRGYRVAGQNARTMYQFAASLVKMEVVEKDSVEVIVHAKVPLIKFVDRITGLRVDMSFENDTGLIANITFNRWKAEYPAMPIITMLIKQFLMMRGMNEVVHGGLGGFSVTCLVTSLLQNMPRVQSGDLIPEQHLGEILIEFLDLYGNQMDISRTGIKMEPPGYFEKRSLGRTYLNNKIDRLAIMDPNQPDNDISGGSRCVSLIFERFARAHREIFEALRQPNRISLLDWMLGGDYSNFAWQRNRLKQIYNESWGRHDPVVVDDPRDGVMQTKNPQDLEMRGVNHLPNKKQKTTSQDPASLGTNSRARYRKKRAARLKAEYPGMSDVPEEIGYKKKNKMIQDYILSLSTSNSQNAPSANTRPRRQPLVDANPQQTANASLPQRSCPEDISICQNSLSDPSRQRKPNISNTSRAASRANQLRRDYPGMQNVPDQVTKSERRQLIEKYRKDNREPIPADPISTRTRSKRRTANKANLSQQPTTGNSPLRQQLQQQLLPKALPTRKRIKPLPAPARNRSTTPIPSYPILVAPRRKDKDASYHNGGSMVQQSNNTSYNTCGSIAQQHQLRFQKEKGGNGSSQDPITID